MNLTSKYRLEQIRRRWWVVAVVTLLGVLSAMALSSQAGTTYVGKSTLMLSGRTPEQDAVMVVRVPHPFNDPATIPRLRTANEDSRGCHLRGSDGCCQPDPDHRGDRRRPVSRAGRGGEHGQGVQ